MTPERKVASAGLSGALSVVLLWAVTTFTAVEMDATVASAITTVVMSLAAYLVPNR